MEFKTLADKIQFYVKNKAEMISLKKSSMKYTEPFGMIDTEANANKALNTNYTDDVSTGIIKRTVIGNTYNWMDSQDDVLCDNCFAVSLKDRQNSIWHLHDHLQQIGAKVGKPVSIYEKAIDWADIGIDHTGKTQALMMDSNIMKSLNASIYEQYLNKEINQHSVGMQYVKVYLAVNDSKMKEEYAVWNKYINNIGNKAEVEAKGMFWAVTEGKLIEISAVLTGANSLTPTLENKMVELLKSSEAEKIQPKEIYSNIARYLKDNPLTN